MNEKHDVHEDELLRRLLKDLDNSMDVPDSADSWNKLKVKLAQRRARTNRFRRFGMTAGIVCLLIAFSIFSNNNPHASARFSSFIKKIQNHVVEIFLNKPEANPNKALTVPPSEESINEPSNSMSAPEKVTLEEAKAKLPSSIKLPEAPPANYALNGIRIFKDSDQQYRTVYMEYTDSNNSLLKLEEHEMTENSGIKTEIAEDYGEIKDVEINGDPAVLMMLPDGMVKLQWIASDVKIYISGFLSETETIDWAKTLR